jgi:hypothetical protein
MHVLSNSVSKAMDLFVGEEAKGSSKFASMFDKFLDGMNVTSL